MAEPRYKVTDGITACEDCGAIVAVTTAGGYRAGSVEAHTRFHSILGSHAWALAVLKTAHIAAHVHDRYEAYDKINSKRFDNWSADALAEVIASHDQPPP